MWTAMLLVSAPIARVDRLLLLLQTRLTVAQDVAMAKYNSGAPIEDLPREHAVLEAVEKAAPTYHVKPKEAHALFLAQIEASKAAQKRMIHAWHGLPHFATAPDLAKDVRPRLDALTPAILQAYGEARPFLSYTAERAPVIDRFAPAYHAEWRIAVAPLNRHAP